MIHIHDDPRGPEVHRKAVKYEVDKLHFRGSMAKRGRYTRAWLIMKDWVKGTRGRL